MRFCILRSGSSGNCAYVEHDGTSILIDAGLSSLKGLVGLLSEIDVEPSTVNGILITHLHSDHFNVSTLRLSRTYNLKIWLHDDNRVHLGPRHHLAPDDNLAFFNTSPVSIGSLQIHPFKVSHDASGTTVGFRVFPDVSADNVLVYAADLGHVPPAVLRHFCEARTIFLEANHDIDMLWNNANRPHYHKVRVAGNRGHLSNVQCAEALVAVVEKSQRPPQRIILGHLSEDNNSPELALDTVQKSLSSRGILTLVEIAPRHKRTPMYTV